MKLRLTKTSDLNAVMEIINQAKSYFKAQGKMVIQTKFRLLMILDNMRLMF